VSFSKDGLISARVSWLAKQELAIAVVTGTDSCPTLSSSRRDGATAPRVFLREPTELDQAESPTAHAL
jgi:hypothetical protein